MPSSGLGAYQVKIHQIVFGGLFIAVAFLGLKGLATGNVTSLKMLGGLSVVAAGVFALDKYYWLVCPFLLVVPFTIPGMPFDSGELGRLLLISIFFVRAALQKGSPSVFPKEILIAFPYFIWVVLGFMLNPTGLNILGSETIGGRFYFQILLGLLTLLTFPRLTISERDARYWVNMLIAALFFHFLLSLSGFSTLELEEDSTRYFLIPAAPLLLILLCRNDLNQMLSLSWRFPVSILLSFAVAYSGKRTAIGQILLAPFILVFLRRRDNGLFVVSTFVGVFLLAFVIAGHGQLYELPFSVQRSLSFLPGKWDQRLEYYGTKDLFREELQRQAKEVIAQKPFFGNSGFAFSRQNVSWAMSEAGGVSRFGNTITSSWHNKWYGMAADFGLPASVLWYFFAILAVAYCIRNRSWFTFCGCRTTCFLYYSLYMFYDLFFAFGHSALTPFEQWTRFGFIIALVRSAKADSKQQIGQIDDSSCQ